MDLKLAGKRAVVTGGSRGIGRVIAELFMKEGAQVVITSKNQKQLQQTAKEMGNSFFVVGDVRNENDVKNVITKTIKKFGRIDILVNNVGVLPKMKPLDKITEKEWNEIIDVNLNGHFRFTKYVIPQMKKKGYSSSFSVAITACSSVMGVVIPPSILMVVWGGLMSVSIGGLFLAGVVPGILGGAETGFDLFRRSHSPLGLFPGRVRRAAEMVGRAELRRRSGSSPVVTGSGLVGPKMALVDIAC
jgi:hypothetical protein